MGSVEISADAERTLRVPPTQPKISHAVLLTSAQVARGLGRTVFVLVVARLLGPRQFGVYALLLAVVEMLAVASGSGYADYLTRESAKDARLGWGLGGQLIGLRLACSAPLVAVTLGILWLLGYSHWVLVAATWLLVTLVPRSVSEVIQGVLRGVDRYRAYLAVELSYDLSLLGGVAFIMLARGALRAVITAELVAAIIAAAASAVFAIMYRTRERIGLSLRQLLEKSVIFNIYAFVGNLYDRVDVVLLSKLAGDYATGVYSAAYRPINTFQLVPYGVLYSLLPSLSRNPKGAEVRQRLERAMGLLLSAAFAVVLATMVFAGPAVWLVLGPGFEESALALKILIWAVILRYVSYAMNVLLLAGGHERVFIATSLGCLSVNVIGNLLLVPLYSWKAAAALTIVTEAVLIAQNVYWLRRTLGMVPRPLGWARMSLVFAALLTTSLLGGRLGAPHVIGSMCVLLFVIYVYRKGMVGEFAAAWGAGRAAAIESSHS